MTKKLLFLDLDGTLLNDNKQITEGNRRALEAALARGHGVVITTGRPLKSALDLARELELDKPGCYTIAFNGALIYDWDGGKVIFRRTVPMDAVSKMFAAAREFGVHIQTYDSREVLVEPWCDMAIVEKYCNTLRMTYRVEEDVCQALEEEPFKMLAIRERDSENMRKLVAFLQGEMADVLDGAFSSATYLDIVRAGMNKGEAVTRLCAMMDIPITNAVAAGDAANDLSMILAAGVGVAMANGTEEVKAAADYVTLRDNNHDGIAEIVDKFLQ
jgi:Cof subfamily protein (haloacid dehalogenase superfamily)